MFPFSDQKPSNNSKKAVKKNLQSKGGKEVCALSGSFSVNISGCGSTEGNTRRHYYLCYVELQIINQNNNHTHTKKKHVSEMLVNHKP